MFKGGPAEFSGNLKHNCPSELQAVPTILLSGILSTSIINSFETGKPQSSFTISIFSKFKIEG